MRTRISLALLLAGFVAANVGTVLAQAFKPLSVVTGFDVLIFAFRDGETLRSRPYSGRTYVLLASLTRQGINHASAPDLERYNCMFCREES